MANYCHLSYEDRKNIEDGLNENASYIVDERNLEYVLYSVEGIILSVIFAIIANSNMLFQIYLFIQKHFERLDKHINFDNGLPSLFTIKRVIAFINPKELETICLDSLHDFLKNNESIYKNQYFIIEEIKSMDRKISNSSDKISLKDEKVAKNNAMGLYYIKNNCCKVTEFIEEKTNEIPTGHELLKRVNIRIHILYLFRYDNKFFPIFKVTILQNFSTNHIMINSIFSKFIFYIMILSYNKTVFNIFITQIFTFFAISTIFLATAIEYFNLFSSIFIFSSIQFKYSSFILLILYTANSKHS